MAFSQHSKKSNVNESPRNAENPVVTYLTVCMLDDGTVVIKDPLPDKETMLMMLSKASEQLQSDITSKRVLKTYGI